MIFIIVCISCVVALILTVIAQIYTVIDTNIIYDIRMVFIVVFIFSSLLGSLIMPMGYLEKLRLEAEINKFEKMIELYPREKIAYQEQILELESKLEINKRNIFYIRGND